jgi:hypothetical protein
LEEQSLNFIIVWVIVSPKRAADVDTEGGQWLPQSAILGYRGWRCGGRHGAAGAYGCQRRVIQKDISQCFIALSSLHYFSASCWSGMPLMHKALQAGRAC